jgi:hypothetical protein
MLTTLYDVELWHEYANQMRALSKRATDPRIRQHALVAAAGFERIAGLAAKLRLTCERRRRSSWARLTTAIYPLL